MHRNLIALVLCLTLGLSACTRAPAAVPEEAGPASAPSAASKQQRFTLPYYSGADLHPILGDNRVNMVLNSLVYQGLFELDNSFSPHGVLCSDYSVSDDGLTWTLSLSARTFSDGSPVTAADVVFSLEMARSSRLYAARLSAVQTISAGDDGTVLLTLVQPNKSLPALLDIPVIRDPQDGSIPLGTGPYRFVEDDGSLRLTQNETAPENTPAEIPLLAMDSADDLIHAFDAGSVSLLVSDLTGANALGYSLGYEAFDFPTTAMLFVGFQTRSGPCADPLLRRALSRGFDRSTVTASLLAGHGEASCLPFSPHSLLYRAAYEQSGGYDPSAAEVLLTEAGYTRDENGLPTHGRAALNLTFVVNTDNSFKLTIAEYLAEQLRSLGVEVTLKKLVWDDYLSALETGDFDLYLGEVTLTADFDLAALIHPEGPLNYGGYANDQMNTLLTGLKQTGQGEAAVLDQFQSDMPFAPLCFKNHSVLIRWQSVSGLEPTRQNPFYHLGSLRFNAAN